MNAMLRCCLAAMAFWSGMVHAKYPEKPLTLVIPFAAGSATDSVARIVAKALSHRIGQPVMVEPKPGANGQLGVTYAAKAAADGYTLLMATSGTHSTNPAMFKSISYDPVKDFLPILLVGEVPFALVVNNDLPAKTTEELVSYAKSNPGKLFFAYASPTAQVAGETFVRMADIKATGVSYKSSPQAAIDLLAGQTQFYFIDFGTGLPHIKNGKLRALAVAGERTNMLPGIPPVSDSVPGFSLTSWNGVFAPAGTPSDVIDYLNRELREVLKLPDVRQALQNIGFETLGTGTPGDFQTLIANDLKKWSEWVMQANIKPQ
ncbi:MAG: Bug family tripartite tricarboxylate transporter substrate binding protein [Noviherbaspirillum sp.]